MWEDAYPTNSSWEMPSSLASVRGFPVNSFDHLRSKSIRSRANFSLSDSY